MKRAIAMIVTAVLACAAVPVGAAQALPAVEKTDRFTLMDAPAADGAGFSMMSADGGLVIHVSDQTPVTFEDGTAARERLAEGQTLAELLDSRNLTVTYSVSTASMPPQTSPDKIVIHYETAVPLPAVIAGPVTVLTGEIVVLGETIDAPAPYLQDGVTMLPLRAIAEKLGYDVYWDQVTQSVRLGNAVNLTIGRDYYTVGRMAPITLGTAPVLKDNRTFVPLDFIGKVLAGYTATNVGGKIVIDKAPNVIEKAPQ